MIIGIDGNEANVRNRVGSNIYAYEILQHIWKLINLEFRVKNSEFNLEFRIYLKNDPLTDLPRQTNWWQYQVLRPKFLWTQWRLPWELFLNKEKIDVFFTPGHYAPRYCPVPLVISIMDLAFLRFHRQFRKRDLYQLINWTKKSVSQADHILTISKFTKKEIEHFYHYPKEKITVTYPGVSKLKTQNSPALPWLGRERAKLKLKTKIFKKYNIKGKYFIYIGTLQPRKNLVRLIKAFVLAINHQPSVTKHLVIIGKKGWLYEEIFNKVKQLKLEKQVIFAGYVKEEEKSILLKNALALILPSLYEGFGIPLLEAMQLGCPVIVSRNSSLPEIAGEAGLYIDNPLSVNSLKKTLLKMVKLNQNQRRRLVDLGFKQIKKFSWLKSTKETLKILKEVADVCH